MEYIDKVRQMVKDAPTMRINKLIKKAKDQIERTTIFSTKNEIKMHWDIYPTYKWSHSLDDIKGLISFFEKEGFKVSYSCSPPNGIS